MAKKAYFILDVDDVVKKGDETIKSWEDTIVIWEPVGEELHGFLVGNIDMHPFRLIRRPVMATCKPCLLSSTLSDGTTRIEAISSLGTSYDMGTDKYQDLSSMQKNAFIRLCGFSDCLKVLTGE